MISERAQVILDFWFKETPLEMRFKKDEKFDQKIKENFLKDYELACQNEYDDWQDNPMSCLALFLNFYYLISFQEIYLEVKKKLLNKIVKPD